MQTESCKALSKGDYIFTAMAGKPFLKLVRTLARCPNQVGKFVGQVLGRIVFVETNVFLVCQNILILLSLFITPKAVERHVPLLASFSRITEPAKYQKVRTVLL